LVNIEVNSVKIDRKLEVLNWNELKTCMRRKFVMPSYLRKERKKLVKIGRKFVDGEK